LRLWSARQNLLSKKDTDHIVERHLLVGFYYVFRLQADGLDVDRLVDLGSGAGIPGILLSIYFKDTPCALLDASRKKVLFLRRVVRDLGLSASVLLGRAEALALPEEEKYSLVVARAVAPVPELARLSSFLIKKNGVLYSIKGKNYKEEMKNAAVNRRCKIKEVPIEGEWCAFSDYFRGKIMLRMEF